MKMEVKTITPTQAKTWLGNNINNRNINKRRVANYAKQILEGDWQLNGEAIKLTEKGALLDGQHRLQAIIQANKPIESYVLTGVKSDVFKTIDTGKGRGAPDILAIAGYENTTTLAACVKAYNGILNNKQRTDSSYISNVSMTNLDILRFVQNTKGFDKAVKSAIQHKKVTKFITPSNAGALYYLFNKKSASDCAQFFHELDTGGGLKENRPTFILREKLISITGYDQLDIRRVKWLIVLHTITAWNAFREKKTIEKLTNPHKFDGYPEIL